MGSSSTQTQKSTSAPWQVQANYLTDAFGKAQNLQQNAYSGDRVAQFTPDQLATFNRMVGYSNNNAIPGQTAGIGGDLASAGAGATTGALNRLGAFSPTGGTSDNIAAANAYADAAANPAAVDAVMRDARRQVSEGALPQVARSSALSGNTMSSRRAISEGLIERGLAEKTADVSANLRQGAFNNGLSLAEQGRQFNNNAMLDALKASGSLGAGAAGTGLGALGNSIGQQGALFELANQGGAGERAAGQAGLDNSISKDDALWANLAKYYGIVGSQNWGGTTEGTATTQNNPGAWQIIGGLLSAGGSLAKISDRRMKHDIYELPFKAPNGLPVYTFRYNGDPSRYVHVGFMAQDVEKVKPEAVTTINGVKHVNYELALAE